MLYLDHNATTPVLPRVREVVSAHLEVLGNPSSLHSHGQRARRALERARQQVAALVGGSAEEVVLVSGGTEALNLALSGTPAHLVCTRVEHRAALAPAARLEARGTEVTWVGVDRHGRVDPAEVGAALRDDTALVVIMAANNEVGTLQPVAEVAALARDRGALVLCDAVQAAGRVPVDVHALGVDLLAVSAHKLGGPQGAGALWVRKGVRLAPLLVGGHQERRRRAGTEPLPALVGFGEACDIARRGLDERARAVREVRDHLEDGVRGLLPDAVVTVPRELRLPNTLHLCIPGVDGEALVMGLDVEGVAASSGSACVAGQEASSHVLRAMGYEGSLLRGALRLSLGPEHTREDMDEVAATLARVVERTRSLEGFFAEVASG